LFLLFSWIFEGICFWKWGLWRFLFELDFYKLCSFIYYSFMVKLKSTYTSPSTLLPCVRLLRYSLILLLFSLYLLHYALSYKCTLLSIISFIFLIVISSSYYYYSSCGLRSWRLLVERLGVMPIILVKLCRWVFMLVLKFSFNAESYADMSIYAYYSC
jgi:hypothetical protein